MFLQVQFLDQTVCNKLLACHNCVFQQDFCCIVVANLICATVHPEFNRPKLRGNLVLSVIAPLVDQDVAYTLLSLFSPHISFISSLFFSQPLPGWSFSVFATVWGFCRSHTKFAEGQMWSLPADSDIVPEIFLLVCNITVFGKRS